MKTLRQFTRKRLPYLRIPAAVTLIAAAVVSAIASFDPPNTRLTNDNMPNVGYVSDYTLVTGNTYTDAVLTACSQSRGRQNEPAVAVDPRNTQVIVGSSNDYCGVFAMNGTFIGLGDVWLGYYRSENSGVSFISSLVPGYQGDQSPYAARAHVRTADSGDPVLAWDSHGRLFAGSESSTNPERPTQTFGDVREPGRRERGDDERWQGIRPFYRCCNGIVRSGPAGEIPRQDGDRGRPYRWRVRRLCVFRLGTLHWGRIERLQLEHLLRALNRPRANILCTDETQPDGARHSVPGHRRDR
jgi:hypothetical protein